MKRALIHVLFALLVLVASAVAHVAVRGENYHRVIYNGDTRQDTYQVSSSLQQLGSSAVVIVYPDSSSLTRNLDGSYSLTSSNTAQNTWNLCPQEAFSQQQIITGSSYCSGFLLSTNPPWIGTARHCAETASSTVGALVLFDFDQLDSTTTKSLYPENDVYTVASIVTKGTGTDFDTDYAVLALDRVVVGRTPYTRVNSTPSVGLPLILIGHPIGLPKKTDADGQLTAIGDGVIGAFVDSYGGNSGSPVFDDAGNLIGILVAGAQDFVSPSGCDISNTCPGGLGCDNFGETLLPICTLGADPVLSVLGFCSSAPSDSLSRSPSISNTNSPSIPNSRSPSISNTNSPSIAISNTPSKTGTQSGSSTKSPSRIPESNSNSASRSPSASKVSASRSGSISNSATRTPSSSKTPQILGSNSNSRTRTRTSSLIPGSNSATRTRSPSASQGSASGTTSVSASKQTPGSNSNSATKTPSATQTPQNPGSNSNSASRTRSVTPSGINQTSNSATRSRSPSGSSSSSRNAGNTSPSASRTNSNQNPAPSNSASPSKSAGQPQSSISATRTRSPSGRASANPNVPGNAKALVLSLRISCDPCSKSEFQERSTEIADYLSIDDNNVVIDAATINNNIAFVELTICADSDTLQQFIDGLYSGDLVLDWAVDDPEVVFREAKYESSCPLDSSGDSSNSSQQSSDNTSNQSSSNGHILELLPLVVFTALLFTV